LPFWAWNGKLDPEELRRQIRLMKRMGLGGFFMHARTGLETAYLSEEWFRCVEACVEEARAITYRRRVTISRGPGERIFLQCPEYRGAAVRVIVNGRTRQAHGSS
jgi:hypothetical protein